MAQHVFIFRSCGAKQVLDSPVGTSPSHPWCLDCERVFSKVFSFNPAPVTIDVTSAGFGYHSSVKSYNEALKRGGQAQYDRLGVESTFESFDPRDTDQSPTTPLARDLAAGVKPIQPSE